ncbi:MAG: V-type ATPase subunit [Candidatus Hodarchaeota archaeon]
MKRVSQYAYINAKIRGMRSKLLTSSTMDSLVGAGNFRMLIRLLESTYYKGVISSIPAGELDPERLDKAFSQDFMERFETVTSFAPGSSKGLLDSMKRKFEASTLKTLIRAKAAKIETDRAMRYVIPVGAFTEDICRGLLETKDIRELAGAIPEPDLRQAVGGALFEYERVNATFPLEVAIDQHVYSELWNDVKKLKGTDKPSGQKLIGTEIDAINIRSVLRSKILALEPELAVSYLLKATYRLGQKDLKEALEAESVSDAIEHLAIHQYRKAMMTALQKYMKEESLAAFEIALDRMRAESNRKVSYTRSPFQVGTILSFLNLKWFEIRNLKAIVTGKVDGLSPAHIRGFLVY